MSHTIAELREISKELREADEAYSIMDGDDKGLKEAEERFLKALVAFQDVTGPTMVESLLDCAEALKFYADGKHIMGESLAGKGNVCPPIGSHAQAALHKLKEAGVTI